MKKILLLSFVLMCCILCNAQTTVLTQLPKVCINDSLQQIIAEEIAKPIHDKLPEWACGVLINKEGQLVALYDSSPIHWNVYQNIHPGSIMMPFTILGALLTNKVDSASAFPITKEGIHTETYRCYDSRPINDTLTVSEIIAIGSHVGMFEIFEQAFAADSLSPQYFNAFMRQLGIETNILNNTDLLKQSYRNEFNISPLHLAWLYHCLAQGLIPEEWKESAAIVRQGMHGVVWNNELGTARKLQWTHGAQSKKVKLMGQTSQQRLNGSSNHHLISFCGSFPEESPEYTCLIMMYDPQYPYSANMDCAVPVRKIAERIYK
jgi:cell division protein FtsI/penicillin-binding protein 2